MWCLRRKILLWGEKKREKTNKNIFLFVPGRSNVDDRLCLMLAESAWFFITKVRSKSGLQSAPYAVYENPVSLTRNALLNSCETVFKEASLINMSETDTPIIYFKHSLIIVPDIEYKSWSDRMKRSWRSRFISLFL